MSNEVIFILFVLVPLFVLGLLMTIAQRKFLKSYREIVNPNKPISTEGVAKLFVQKAKKPEELLKFIKQDLNNYPEFILNLYGKHFKNPKLEKEAAEVRRLTLLTIIIPFLGFIFAFLLALR